jgi:hypothetical protein
MEKDPFLIEYIFMAVVILYSIYQLFFSKKSSELEQEIAEKLEARPILNVIRYLTLLTFNSYFAHMFFDIGWLLWISFLSFIALWVLLVELKFNLSSVVAVLLVILFFLGSSLPRDSRSFERYISDQTDFECLRIECLKITEVITEDTFKTEVNPFFIQDSSFDWYLFFARGSLILKDENGNVAEFSGVNIGGLWLLRTNND